MKRQRHTAQMKEQTRNREVQINQEEIGKLPEKEFRIMMVKMIKNLENKMEKMLESISKDREDLKNKRTETNNIITEVKNTLEGISSRISEAERISKLEDIYTCVCVCVCIYIILCLRSPFPRLQEKLNSFLEEG